MAGPRDISKAAGVGSAAVMRATGRDWNQWFRLLDIAGGRSLGHRRMARWLADEHGCSPWWSQMITVAFEQVRGLRRPGEMPGGFQVSVSRTMSATTSALYGVLRDAASPDGWLAEPRATLRPSTSRRIVRLDWKDGRSRVEVRVAGPGPGRATVTVRHSKLAAEKDVIRMRRYWRRKLEALAGKVGRRASVAPRGSPRPRPKAARARRRPAG